MDNDFVQVGRDCFARFDIIRRLVETTRTCDWCGNKRKSGKLFEYGIWHDGGRKGWAYGLFCSRSCSNAYHGH
jgi:hypothetical protein